MGEVSAVTLGDACSPACTNFVLIPYSKFTLAHLNGFGCFSSGSTGNFIVLTRIGVVTSFALSSNNSFPFCDKAKSGTPVPTWASALPLMASLMKREAHAVVISCLLYTSDAADD